MSTRTPPSLSKEKSKGRPPMGVRVAATYTLSTGNVTFASHKSDNSFGEQLPLRTNASLHATKLTLRVRNAEDRD